jgi:hypothetical protein
MLCLGSESATPSSWGCFSLRQDNKFSALEHRLGRQERELQHVTISQAQRSAERLVTEKLPLFWRILWLISLEQNATILSGNEHLTPSDALPVWRMIPPDASSYTHPPPSRFPPTASGTLYHRLVKRIKLLACFRRLSENLMRYHGMKSARSGES